jgi:hypothetical protein
MTVQMLAPIPFSSTIQTSNGNTYTLDADGFVQVQPIDVHALLAAGFTFAPMTNLIGKLLSANFNIITDQPFSMLIPAGKKFRITKITALNTSVAGMSTAAGGVYPAASKGGSAIVANTQVFTGLTNAATALDLTLAAAAAVQAAGNPIVLSLTTPQGAAATADLYAFGDLYV